jgi:transposase-like protein
MFILSPVKELQMGRKSTTMAEAVWRERMARFRRGGLSVAEFCRREGVSDPSFYQWRKRLERNEPLLKQSDRSEQRTTAGQDLASFVSVRVTAASTAMAEIEFRNGVRIRIPATDAEALRVALRIGNETCQGGDSC